MLLDQFTVREMGCHITTFFGTLLLSTGNHVVVNHLSRDALAAIFNHLIQIDWFARLKSDVG